MGQKSGITQVIPLKCFTSEVYKRSAHVGRLVYSNFTFIPQNSRILFHNSLTHPLSLDFTRWPSLGPAQLPGGARPGKTESGEA